MQAIILAAGEGRRMKSEKTNKVVATLGDKQMILHTVDRLKEMFFDPIIVVVGFAKESVVKVLDGKVGYAYQNKRLGTAHAVSCAMEKLSEDAQSVLVLGGDDSAFFTKDIIENLVKMHQREKPAVSFLTIMVDDPTGLGRIIRNEKNEVEGIIEDKDATESQKRIKEINPECYIFEVSFLKQNLSKVKKSSATGEYYLTSLIDIAIKNKDKLIAVSAGKIPWRGINNLQELKEAERLFAKLGN